MILDRDHFMSIDGLKDCDWLWPIMLQWRPHCHVTRLSDFVYLVAVIPHVYLFASQHCHSTFRKLLTPRCLTFNLTHTISYGSYGTNVVIYIPVFVH